ncbi:hypothetical protein RFI_24603, partial [Reticulomyxa filosa]
ALAELKKEKNGNNSNLQQTLSKENEELTEDMEIKDEEIERLKEEEMRGQHARFTELLQEKDRQILELQLRSLEYPTTFKEHILCLFSFCKSYCSFRLRFLIVIAIVLCGQYDVAIQYYEKVLQIQLKRLGRRHIDVASSYYYLGLDIMAMDKMTRQLNTMKNH